MQPKNKNETVEAKRTQRGKDSRQTKSTSTNVATGSSSVEESSAKSNNGFLLLDTAKREKKAQMSFQTSTRVDEQDM